jgi:hypothetical protein
VPRITRLIVAVHDNVKTTERPIYWEKSEVMFYDNLYSFDDTRYQQYFILGDTNTTINGIHFLWKTSAV